jgi:hypothetical protein
MTAYDQHGCAKRLRPGISVQPSVALVALTALGDSPSCVAAAIDRLILAKGSAIEGVPLPRPRRDAVAYVGHGDAPLLADRSDQAANGADVSALRYCPTQIGARIPLRRPARPSGCQ